MIVLKKRIASDIRAHAGGLWVGALVWKYGDWDGSLDTARPRTGRRYANIYVSFFPGCPVLCLTYFNKSAWLQKLRDNKKQES